jgi:truncated hemoglobin YjbI
VGSVDEAAGGDEGLRGLAEAWHRRVLADEVVGHAFDDALEEVGLRSEPLRQVLHDDFAWATSSAMSRYHRSADDVPDGLVIPRWSWDGLQR